MPPAEAVDIPALRERYRQERSRRMRPEGQRQYVAPTDHFGELLINLFSAAGDMPRKIRFHDFTLAYSGE